MYVDQTGKENNPKKTQYPPFKEWEKQKSIVYSGRTLSDPNEEEFQSIYILPNKWQIDHRVTLPKITDMKNKLMNIWNMAKFMKKQSSDNSEEESCTVIIQVERSKNNLALAKKYGGDIEVGMYAKDDHIGWPVFKGDKCLENAYRFSSKVKVQTVVEYTNNGKTYANELIEENGLTPDNPYRLVKKTIKQPYGQRGFHNRMVEVDDRECLAHFDVIDKIEEVL